MSELRALVDDQPAEAADGLALTWVDRASGIARLTSASGEEALTVVVEGDGQDWHVTIRGRRIPVTVRSHRERLLAEAAEVSGAHAGPVEVRASLPGLVVAVETAVGAEVEEGAPLLTIEAMKMQNEVRAPRAGSIVEVAVSAGQSVATGALLLRLE